MIWSDQTLPLGHFLIWFLKFHFLQGLACGTVPMLATKSNSEIKYEQYDFCPDAL